MLVYKFCKKDTKECVYVGSTIKTLCHRLRNHKYRSTTARASPFHKYVLDNGGWDCFEISLVEDCSISNIINSLYLKQRERYWWETLNPICNKNKPYKTQEEYNTYYETNKEMIKARQKLYYETNKEVINANRRKP